MDTYAEYMVKKKRTTKDYILIALIILWTIVALAVAAVLLMFTFVGTFGFIIGFAAVYGAYRLITAQKIEYEYLVTNGHIDIDKIISQRKRKRVVSVPGSRMDTLLPYDNQNKAELSQGRDRFIIAASGSDSPNLWYFTYSSKKNGKSLIVFEPNEKVLRALQTKLSGSTLRETKKYIDEQFNTTK